MPINQPKAPLPRWTRLVTALTQNASGHKGFADLPVPRATSYLHQTHTATRTPSQLYVLICFFTLTEPSCNIESIQQKYNSRKVPGEKALAGCYFNGTHQTASHTLLSALSFSALCTVTILQSHSQNTKHKPSCVLYKTLAFFCKYTPPSCGVFHGR